MTIPAKPVLILNLNPGSHTMGGILGLVNAMLTRPDAWFKRHTIAAIMFGEFGLRAARPRAHSPDLRLEH